MNFLHYELQLSSRDVVEVSLDKQANVRLMDEPNFQKFKRGRRHAFYGGKAIRSPIRINPAHAGQWHLVVDLGGYKGKVKASVKTLRL
jgi:hypothetical protein